jgi:hypothetical protein
MRGCSNNSDSLARGWFLSAHLGLMAGQPDLAVTHLETSLRLSPREQVGGRMILLGVANFFNRRFQDAAAHLLVAIQEFPNGIVAHRYLASRSPALQSPLAQQGCRAYARRQ